MLVTDMVTAIQAHGFDDESTTLILSAINDAQDEMCNRHPWTFLEATVTNVGTIVASWSLTTATNFPTDVRSLLVVYNSTLDQTLKGVETKTVYDQYFADISNTAQGAPQWFYNIGTDYRLYPTPDAVYTFSLVYLKTPAVIDDVADTLTVPSRYHRIVMTGALAYLYFMRDDDGKGKLFEDRFDKKIIEAINDDGMRQYSNPRVVNMMSSSEYLDDM